MYAHSPPTSEKPALITIANRSSFPLNVGKTSSHYNRESIFLPARSLLMYDINVLKGPRGTRGNWDISGARFMRLKVFVNFYVLEASQNAENTYNSLNTLLDILTFGILTSAILTRFRKTEHNTTLRTK